MRENEMDFYKDISIDKEFFINVILQEKKKADKLDMSMFKLNKIPNINLKKELISKNIFVATYWPNVFEWTKPEDIEYKIAESVVCIPIDQRYGKEEMGLIIKEIQKCC